jgi:hypothetical protein
MCTSTGLSFILPKYFNVSLAKSENHIKKTLYKTRDQRESLLNFGSQASWKSSENFDQESEAR